MGQTPRAHLKRKFKLRSVSRRLQWTVQLRVRVFAARGAGCDSIRYGISVDAGFQCVTVSVVLFAHVAAFCLPNFDSCDGHNRKRTKKRTD